MSVNAFTGLTPPSTDDPLNFDERADLWLAAFLAFQAQVNATEANINAKEASAVAAAAALLAAAAAAVQSSTRFATSDSPQTMTTGAKVFPLNEAGRGFKAGEVLIAYRRNASGTRLKLIADADVAGGVLNATVPAGGVIGAGGPYSDWAIVADPFVPLAAASANDVKAGVDGVAVTPKAQDDADAGAALGDAATVTWNIASVGAYARLLLTTAVGSTRQIGQPTNPKDGKVYVLDLQQPAAGGPCSATFSSYFDFTGVTVSWSTAASKVDRLVFLHNATTGKGEVMSWRKGS